MASPVAPTISATGISAPGFPEILAYLKSQYQAIFGADAYLGNDSQDGQFIAIIARALADCNASAVAVYNAFSPATAQGNGLASVVKINGLQKRVPSASTCELTIVGVAQTLITNGQAQDGIGNVWALPATVTIPNGGSIVVQAICQTQGAIAAAIGTITKVKTPVYGWQTVNNATAAIAGSAVETDAALRVRQSQSVAAPSQTIFEGVMASIGEISGITRMRGYENATTAADGNGIAARSVAIFVEGGDAAAIQQVIARKITPGTPTLGNISTTVVDRYGSSRMINFARPTAASIYIELTLKALAGWSTSIQPIIAQAIADYVNTLRIGEPVRYFDLAMPAKIIGSPYASAFSLSAMRLKKNNGGAFGTADLAIAYNEAPIGSTANVTFVIT